MFSVFFDLAGEMDVGVLFVDRGAREKREFLLCVQRYKYRQRGVTRAVLFDGKLQERVPRCFASQFLRQQRKQATPWLFRELPCNYLQYRVFGCTGSKSM